MARPHSMLLHTLMWFDIFDYPLTAWEVWKWMLGYTESAGANTIRLQTWERENDIFPYRVIASALDELIRQKKLEQKWSFYFLPGREEIVEIRRQRYMLARKKFTRARSVARWFRVVPFVRCVAVCNTLGYSNAAEESDIDLFIITAPGKIWTVRAICLLFLRIFHLRPLLVRFGAKREEREDKIDLSFFVATDALDISSLALQSEVMSYKKQETNNFQFPVSNFQNQSLVSNNHFLADPYLIFWLVQLTPLWDYGGVYQKFWNANSELRQFTRAAFYMPSSLRVVSSSWIYRVLQACGELFFSAAWIERAFRFTQMYKMPARIKEMAGSEGVCLRDSVLKFHDIDRRREYCDRWVRRLNGLG